jgi:lipopolysaccharide transport system permease protein
MTNSISMLIRSRHILWATTLNEVRARYVGSVLGLVWMVLYPFLFLGIYAVVFTFILRVRLEQFTSTECILMIFAGLIPFIGFSEALSASAPAVVGNKPLLKNTMFPVELLPVKAVLAASVTMTVGLVGLLLCLWTTGHVSPVQILVIPVLFLQIMFSVGLGWFVSALTVFFRDLLHIIGVLIMFLMLVSPIGYTREMIPQGMKPFMAVNPLYYMIDVYRELLFFGRIPGGSLLALIGISVCTYVVGRFFFTRLEPVFAEYV